MVVFFNGFLIEVKYCVDLFEEYGNVVFIISEKKVWFFLMIWMRKVGDWIKLKGMNGLKKVKDIFIDKKLFFWERDNWLIVMDVSGEIIWILGLKKLIFEDFVILNSDCIVL